MRASIFPLLMAASPLCSQASSMPLDTATISKKILIENKSADISLLLALHNFGAAMLDLTDLLQNSTNYTCNVPGVMGATYVYQGKSEWRFIHTNRTISTQQWLSVQNKLKEFLSKNPGTIYKPMVIWLDFAAIGICQIESETDPVWVAVIIDPAFPKQSTMQP